METKIMVLLVAIGLRFLEFTCCDANGKNAVTTDSYDSLIPTYWKMEIEDSFNIGWDVMDEKLIVQVAGLNYYDLGHNRLEPITLIPVGNYDRFDDNINRFFDIKFRVSSDLQPDMSKPMYKEMVNGTEMGVAYVANVGSSYKYYSYSPINHRDDIPVSWELDITKPTRSRMFRKNIIMYFSIRKINN